MATIEELERMAAEIEEGERAAAHELAAFLRDLAVRLPAGSNMAPRLAGLAKTVDLMAGGPSPLGSALVPLSNELRAWKREGES